MHLTLSPVSNRIRSSRTARERRSHAPVRRSVSVGDAQVRARRSGGPEDRALYLCDCGTAFSADVSAAVPCPACGDQQAW